MFDEGLQFGTLDVVELGRQQQRGAGAQFPVLLGDQMLEAQFLKVNIALRYEQVVELQFVSSNLIHFALYTAQLA